LPGDAYPRLLYHNLFLTNKEELVTNIIQRRIDLLNAKAEALTPVQTVPNSPVKGGANLRGNNKDKTGSNDNTKARSDSLSLIKAALLLSRKEMINFKHYNSDTSLSLFLNYFFWSRHTERLNSNHIWFWRLSEMSPCRKHLKDHSSYVRKT
jgi:hypothetical protein